MNKINEQTILKAKKENPKRTFIYNISSQEELLETIKELKYITNLKEIELYDSKNIMDLKYDASVIKEELPQIELLILKNTITRDFKKAIQAYTKLFPNLKKLIIEENSYTCKKVEIDVEFNKELPNLEHLSLENFSNISLSEKSIKSILELKNLTHLSLEKSTKLAGSKEFDNQFKVCENLQHLNIKKTGLKHIPK